MAESSIPVDLFNPGQVFACLGFLEAADVLLGDAEGGFDWRNEADVRFRMQAAGDGNPFAIVLEFLAAAKPQRWAPLGYSDPPPKKGEGSEETEDGEDIEDIENVGLKKVNLPDVHFGYVGKPKVDWRTVQSDDNDDDEELEETPPDVIMMLGFDPNEFNDEDDVKEEIMTDPKADPIDGSKDKGSALELSEVFYAIEGDRMSLPIRLGGGNRPAVELGHWADGSSRESFKLYAGNRSADRIARAMLVGVRGKPKKNQTIGELKTKGVAQLWEEQREALIERPFHILTPMGGSFNFDPRGAWTAIDAGYSPNDQKHHVAASPVVEFLAAWGLENARPDEFETRKVRYAAWGIRLPPMLARVALFGGISALLLKRFRFELDMSGKNKVVTFSELETSS
jgi:CRISPR-associated protein Csb3